MVVLGYFVRRQRKNQDYPVVPIVNIVRDDDRRSCFRDLMTYGRAERNQPNFAATGSFVTRQNGLLRSCRVLIPDLPVRSAPIFIKPARFFAPTQDCGLEFGPVDSQSSRGEYP